jgi:HlyD family secretion protein
MSSVRPSHRYLCWILGAFASCAPSTNAQTIDRVTAAPVVAKSLKLTTTQPSRILAYEETPLQTKLSGYIQAVLVDIGDRVAKDQVVVRLAVPELADEIVRHQALVEQAAAEVQQAMAAAKAVQAMVESAEAKVQEAMASRGRAAAELDLAKSERQRMERLVQSGSVTQKLADELRSKFLAAEAACVEVEAKVRSVTAQKREVEAEIEKAEADIVASQARARVAKANLAQAETMYAYRELKAPYAGVITHRAVDTGHYVQSTSGVSAPLLTMARTDQLRLKIEIPEVEAGYVDVGPEGDEVVISVQALNRPPLTSRLTRTSWALDAANRSLRTEVDLANQDQLLRPGMYATATVTLAQRSEAIVLPTTAIYRKDSGPYCCVVKDEQVEHRPLQLGLKSGNEVEVLSGLAVGEVVVTIRGEGLVAGQRVSILPAK